MESSDIRSASGASDKIPTGTGLEELMFQFKKLPEVTEVGPDVTLRMKVQLVPQSETSEVGINSSTLVPCTTHKRKTSPALKGGDASSYMLLQDAWFQLEEARLLCEKLEAPPLISDDVSGQSKKKPSPPKKVCDVATQAASQPQLLGFIPSGIENSLKRENMDLRSQLRRSRSVLQQTYDQLSAANQRKRVVEDVVCNSLVNRLSEFI